MQFKRRKLKFLGHGMECRCFRLTQRKVIKFYNDEFLFSHNMKNYEWCVDNEIPVPKMHEFGYCKTRRRHYMILEYIPFTLNEKYQAKNDEDDFRDQYYQQFYAIERLLLEADSTGYFDLHGNNIGERRNGEPVLIDFGFYE